MKVLVCGGRDFLDRSRLYTVMDELKLTAADTIIHGGARGADCLSGIYAGEKGIKTAVYKADWATHGKAAGPIRNQQMLDDAKPDLVIAFPGGIGTADMVRKAKAAKVRVLEVGPRGEIENTSGLRLDGFGLAGASPVAGTNKE